MGHGNFVNTFYLFTYRTVIASLLRLKQRFADNNMFDTISESNSIGYIKLFFLCKRVNVTA